MSLNNAGNLKDVSQLLQNMFKISSMVITQYPRNPENPEYMSGKPKKPGKPVKLGKLGIPGRKT